MRRSLAVAGVELGREGEVKGLRSEISGASRRIRKQEFVTSSRAKFKIWPILKEAGDHVTKPRMKGYIREGTGLPRPLCLKTSISPYLSYLHCKYMVILFSDINEISEHILNLDGKYLTLDHISAPTESSSARRSWFMAM